MRFLLVLMFCLSTLPAVAGKKALVLGNSAYLNSQHLRNALNDALDVSLKLQSIGFEVYQGLDLTRSDTLRLVQDFANTLAPDDIALLFFAGHGVQFGGRNYLLPVDAQIGSQSDMIDSAVDVQSILQTLENRSRTRIVILDSCRDNPFAAPRLNRSGTQTRGLARMEAGIGSFIAFATEPGSTASDGNGRNSPFTAALLRHITTPGADLHAIMRAVRLDVVSASRATQVPWENSSLISEVFLHSPSPNLRAPLNPTPQPSANPSRVNNAQIRVLPAPLLSPAPLPSRFTHRVAGLDPNGDGFLALRTGTTPSAQRIAKMTEGTRLNILQSRGAWRLVETETGLRGWAHSNWIQTNQQRTTPSQPASLCDQLWWQRNSYFASAGYCFQSPRGRATFGHLPCTPGLTTANINLSSADRAAIAAIQARESALQCN